MDQEYDYTEREYLRKNIFPNCPNCGSSNHKEVSDDGAITCTDCDTSYYMENFEINASAVFKLSRDQWLAMGKQAGWADNNRVWEQKAVEQNESAEGRGNVCPHCGSVSQKMLNEFKGKITCPDCNLAYRPNPDPNIYPEEGKGIKQHIEPHKQASWQDKMKGGLADDCVPEDFNQEQLNIGIKKEMEHGQDKHTAKEIAMDHLAEDPNYYKKLETMENE